MPLHQDVAPIVKLCGGPTKLADRLKIRPASIYDWRRIPSDKFDDVADAAGMRPDQLRQMINQMKAGKPPAVDAA